MEKLLNPLTGRTRRRVVFAAALAVLAFVTLIPFHYQKTVGYEVAFAGVNKELAMDQGKIEILLSKLGMSTAKVDLANCEATTCSLVVSNLKSKDDCQALVYAMREIGDCRVVSEGSPQCEPASGSLVELAKHNVFFISEGSNSEDVEKRVVECLGKDFPECVSVWVDSEDNSMMVELEGVAGCEPNLSSCTKMAACTLMVAGIDGMHCVVMGDSACVPDSACLQMLNGCGGQIMRVHGDIDEATREMLKARGFDVRVSEDGDTKMIQILKDGSAQGSAPGEESADAARSAITPDGYVLDQNYPNPFNPSTAISFTIPRSERVRIDVINLLGQRIRTLVDETMSAGVHEVQWDATSDNGKRVPSGTYLYHITAGDFNASRTMTLLK